ncbi:MAG TPA: SGNH/GDSL hydrolase family protein [Thermoleophilia bacterium]|nr:SGNH/GDSL hydrolase family protein [Thermoleophilia bacterium]
MEDPIAPSNASVQAPLRSFVAVGDSFTEGLTDTHPDGRPRGWADLVAERLAAFEPGFRYANLAVRGKLMGQIGNVQAPAAAAMSPDLAAFAGGINDVARPNCDLDAVCEELVQCAAVLTASCRRVVTFQPMDYTRRMPSLQRFAPKVTKLMEAVERARVEHGVIVVDLSVERVFDDPRLWAPDRVHLSYEGHRRVAEGVLEALGYEPLFDWRAELPPAKRPGRIVKKWSDVVWLAKYFAPWIKRRLTGTSSGDNVLPKRPNLLPLLEQTVTDVTGAVNNAVNSAGLAAAGLSGSLNNAGLGGALGDQAA